MDRETQNAILIADDDSGSRELTKMMLELEGFTVLDAEDADEALRLWLRHQPSVALVDVNMPPGETGGLHFVERVLNAGADPMRIILLTGNQTPRVEAFAREQGVRLWLKPVEPEAILRVCGGL